MAFTANASRFESDLLRALGAPVTHANLLALRAWQQAEGGSAAYNPFNTTQQAPGAHAYNSVGVRSYGSYQQGLRATEQTLENGRYGAIIAALRAGHDPYRVAAAIGASPWGTSGSLVSQVLHGGADTRNAQWTPGGVVAQGSAPSSRGAFASRQQLAALAAAIAGQASSPVPRPGSVLAKLQPVAPAPSDAHITPLSLLQALSQLSPPGEVDTLQRSLL